MSLAGHVYNCLLDRHSHIRAAAKEIAIASLENDPQEYKNGHSRPLCQPNSQLAEQKA
jgi:hypothetical protein